jgi:NAD(P)-dependent dehydrogenase (short-subunit alcohol dehydrogenase family)
MSTTPLHGKIALVTGASRGIGRAIALKLARDGAQVFVHYSGSREAAEALANEVAALGGDDQARLVQADLSTMAGINALSEQVWAEGSCPLDILVNNAGIQLADGIAGLTSEAFDALMAINVKAPFFLTQRLLPRLADGGRVINMSSGLSQIAFPDKMAYAMGKAAIVSFTKSLAKELGPRGITVNAVAPGIIDTDMNPWVRSPGGAARVAGVSALGRVGQPADVADVVAFLAGHNARWITGAFVDASGGSLLG